MTSFARRDAPFATVLFVVALALRLGAAFAFAGEPVWDGHYYDFGARRIAEGHGYSDDLSVSGQALWHPWCHYPVGYSGYLALFYKVLGATAGSAHVANALAGALLALVTFLLARECLDSKRARLAGLLVALHPGLVLYGALSMSEPLAALLTFAAFLAAIVTARRRPDSRVWAPAVGGVVLGVAALVRPQALLCAPFLALAVPQAGHAERAGFARFVPRIRAAAIACAVAVATLLPWTARNCRVMDGCALVSTNAGWNLAIGAFPRATGRFETLRSSDGCREVTGQVQQDRCWLAYGMHHIAKDPWRWLGLVPKKLAFTFDHESFPVEYLHEARPGAWPEPRRAMARTVLTAFHRFLVVAAALAFVGARVSPRDRTREPRSRVVQMSLLALVALASYAAGAADEPAFWVVVLIACAIPWLPVPGRPDLSPGLAMAVSLLGTTALAHAVFFGDDRYHIVASPALCLLAAGALRSLRSEHKTHAARPPEGARRVA